jgi:hypothetical protein
MDTPEGFAAFADTGAVRVISPEGVVMRVRTVANEPEQSLGFWSEALELQLTESGYLLVDKAEMTMGTEDGVLMEWLAPVGEEDWIYVTGISVVDTLIAVVEAAGPVDQFAEYRQEIRRALESLRVESDP